MTEFLKRRAAAISLIILAGGLFYLSTTVSGDRIEVIAQRLGWFGPLLIALYILLTQLFPPISSTPGIFVGIKLYGYINTLIIFYLTCMAGATINFWIARLYGRRVVGKLVGEKNLQRIDELSSGSETTLLVTSRIFGYFLFETISYAVGLTSISFKKYFTYTAVLTVIPVTTEYFVFRNLDFNSSWGMLIYFGSLALTGVVFTKCLYGIFFKKRMRKAQASHDELSSIRFMVSLTLGKMIVQIPLFELPRIPKLRRTRIAASRSKNLNSTNEGMERVGGQV